LIIRGDYDITKYLQFYHLPLDLQNKSVLDIGSASGYFALECARRGGKVTAIDIYDRTLLSDLLPLINADVNYIQKSIYELDASWGEFDLVICGSVLCHLPDLFGAIQRIRSICRGQTIISTACCSDSRVNPHPICEFRARKATDGNYWHFWDITATALRTMLLTSGFSEVKDINHFTLTSELDRTKFATPHVVMTGIV
jgi:2-polyprenyl-3-methyl-5-hydroxy-6-metoxy-1,4-benzoquinol methylase